MFGLSRKFLKPKFSRFGSSHGASSQEPGGYFLGMRPGRPTYFWEPIWYIGYYGSMVVLFAGLYFNPRKGPTERATIEAKKRMEARGSSEKNWPFPQSVE